LNDENRALRDAQIYQEQKIYYLEQDQELIGHLILQGCSYKHRWSSGGCDFYDTPKLRRLINEYDESHREPREVADGK